MFFGKFVFKVSSFDPNLVYASNEPTNIDICKYFSWFCLASRLFLVS